MSRLIVFNVVTIDGYYAGVDNDISWHNTDEEFSKFADEQTAEFGTQIYGRITYELMKSYWPTEQGLKDSPIVALLMNNTPKIVYSKTLAGVQETETWKNVTVLPEINTDEVKKWKVEATKDLVIFGSGKIMQQFTNLGLIDEYRLLINPLIIGSGKLLFENIHNKHQLKLVSIRQFKNGNVLLTYQI